MAQAKGGKAMSEERDETLARVTEKLLQAKWARYSGQYHQQRVVVLTEDGRTAMQLLRELQAAYAEQYGGIPALDLGVLLWMSQQDSVYKDLGDVE